MPNEFIIKNGFFSEGSSNVTGSLIVTQGITGSLFGTASYVLNGESSSYSLNSTSASYALTASYATNALTVTQITPVTLASGSWSLTGSYYNYVYSNAIITATSIVDVIPATSSISIVRAADILPSTLSASETVTMYATNAPTGDIIVTFNIFK